MASLFHCLFPSLRLEGRFTSCLPERGSSRAAVSLWKNNRSTRYHSVPIRKRFWRGDNCEIGPELQQELLKFANQRLFELRFGIFFQLRIPTM
jgi:hypothetical protein